MRAWFSANLASSEVTSSGFRGFRRCVLFLGCPARTSRRSIASSLLSGLSNFLVCEVGHALMYLHDQAHRGHGPVLLLRSCARCTGASHPAWRPVSQEHHDAGRQARLGGRCLQVPLDGCLDFQEELLHILACYEELPRALCRLEPVLIDFGMAVLHKSRQKLQGGARTLSL